MISQPFPPWSLCVQWFFLWFVLVSFPRPSHLLRIRFDLSGYRLKRQVITSEVTILAPAHCAQHALFKVKTIIKSMWQTKAIYHVKLVYLLIRKSSVLVFRFCLSDFTRWSFDSTTRKKKFVWIVDCYFNTLITPERDLKMYSCRDSERERFSENCLVDVMA